MKSKDPVTRVGAVIVGSNKEIRSTGFNGLPRGIADTKLRYDDKEFKIMAVNHAEENAILNCALNDVATKGCTYIRRYFLVRAVPDELFRLALVKWSMMKIFLETRR
jgi:deoxycytidylate deaminase